MKFTVDRIEEDIIVLELPDLSHISVPAQLIPTAKEGDVYEIKKNDMNDRKIKIENLEDELFQ